MRSHPYVASIFTSTLAAGALIGSETEPSPESYAACARPPAVSADYTDMSVEEMVSGMEGMTFVIPGAEYNRHNQLQYPSVLASKGVTVVENINARQFNPLEYDDVEGNNWLFQALGDMPTSVVEAAGLKRVVIDRVNSTDDYYEIHHSEDTLWAKGSFEISNGLAAMVLDNYCDTETVLSTLENITAEGGHQYTHDTNEDYDAYGGYEQWNAAYGDAFEAVWTARNPRIEFISTFSDLLQGWGWYGERDLASPLSRKQAYIMGILKEIEPHVEAFQQLHNYGGGIGTHGLPPERLVARVACMTERLAGAQSKEEYDYFIEEDFGDVPNDPALRDCDGPRLPGVLGVMPAQLMPRPRF